MDTMRVLVTRVATDLSTSSGFTLVCCCTLQSSAHYAIYRFAASRLPPADISIGFIIRNNLVLDVTSLAISVCVV